MSGHSKWSQIRHKKGIADQKKGQLFSKFSKIISLAARKGTDLSINIELKNAVEQAKSFNMPNDSIQRAIKKAEDKNSSQLSAIRVEAVGPSGSAFVIEAITDNKNRTISEMKIIIKKNEFKMATPNSLLWMFDRHGVELSPKNTIIPPQEGRAQIEAFLNEAGEHEDVKEIYSNVELDESRYK